MKTIFAIFAGLFCVQYNAFACSPREAQFIGQATQVTQTSKNGMIECTYKVDQFSWFGSSVMCPLVVGEASSLIIKDPTCSLKNGDAVSGILGHHDDGRVTLE